MKNHKFDLYLENERGEKLDLISGSFFLYVDTLEFKRAIEYDSLSIYQYIYTSFKRELSESYITIKGACDSVENWLITRDFLCEENQQFKLVFKDYNEGELHYHYCAYSNITKRQKLRFDEYDIDIDLKILSNWINERTYLYNTNNGEELSNYDYEYDFEYGYDNAASDYNSFQFENTGHENAPVKITIPNGANNLEFEISDLQGKKYITGKLNLITNQTIVIDTSMQNKGIFVNGVDVRHLRDRSLSTFGVLPKGKYVLIVKNTRLEKEFVKLVVYNQLRVV
ncbi:MAG: phage distal tail protein [Oscillospiraceae bacterium]